MNFINRLKSLPVRSGIIISALLALSFTSFVHAGNVLNVFGTVYYKDPATGTVTQGTQTSMNSLANVAYYRNNLPQAPFQSMAPTPGKIFYAQEVETTDPAYFLWDAGSSQFNPYPVAGDEVVGVVYAKNGMNGYTGASYVGAGRRTVIQSDLNGSSIDFPEAIVMEKVPTPTFVSSAPSSITMRWTGLVDKTGPADTFTLSGGGTPANTVTGYTVYRSNDNGVSWTALPTSAAQSAGGTITYTDSSTVHGTNYRYKLGVRFVWASGPSGYYEPTALGEPSVTMTMASLEPVKTSFISAPQTITAGANSLPITIETRDATGNPSNVTSNTTISLSSSSSGVKKFFMVSGGACTTTEISSLVITTGNSSGQFCYNDEKAGSWTLTPSKVDPASPVWASDPQTITVNSSNTVGSMSLSLTNSQRNRTAFTGTNTLTMTDVYGNTMTTFNPASSNITFSVSPTATISGLNGTSNAQLTQAADFLNGVANLSSKLQLAGVAGNYTITATSANGKTATGTVSLSASATVDHFDFILNPVQRIGINFTGTNTLTAKDADNNTITDFNAANTNVTLAEATSSGSVLGLGSGSNGILNQSSNFVNGVANLPMRYTGTSGSHSFKATAGAVSSTSGTVNFSAGALARFVLAFNSPQPVGTAFSSASITAKDTSDNTITNFDASTDNVTVTVNTGTVTGNTLNIGGSFINGVATLSNLVYTGGVGSRTYTATSSTGKTGTANADMIAGPATSIKIVNGSTDTATPVDTRTIAADQLLTLYAAGYDAGGNWSGLVNANWTSDGTISPAVAVNTASTLNYNPVLAPASGTVTATNGAMSDSTGTITITPGAIHHFDSSITSPQKISKTFIGSNTLTAKDADNNTITNFNASTTNVTITEFLGNGTVSGLGSIDNNVLNQPSSFVNGVADISGMKYAGTSGGHVFKITTSGGVSSNTSTIQFGAGDLAKFSLTLNSPQQVGVPFATAIVTAMDSSDNTITGFDASTDNVSISVSTGTLTNNTLTSAGSFVNGIATLNGSLSYSGTTGQRTYTVTSVSGKTGGNTANMTAGPTTSIKIVNSSTSTATEVTDRTLTADQSLALYAAGYDAGGNWTGLQSGNWTSTGTLDPAVNTTNSNTFTFNPVKAPTSGTISFSNGSLSSSTGTISVGLGSLKQFKLTFTTPQRIDTPFTGLNTITAQDNDGNTIPSFDASVTPVSLTETTGTGTISGLGSSNNNVLNRSSDFVNGIATISTMKYSGTINTHSFRATAGTLTGTSNPVSFTSGPLASFSFILNTPQPTGSAFTTATLTAKDVYGNIVTDFDASTDAVTITANTGTVTGNVLNQQNSFIGGVADMAGTLTYSGPTGIKSFTATSASNVIGNATSTISGGSATTIKLVNGTSDTASEINNHSMNSDQTFTMYAAGYDAGGNWTGLINVNWTSEGTLEPVVSATNTSTFTFDPSKAPASGIIKITVSGMEDVSGTIDVTHGEVNTFDISLTTPQKIASPFTGTNTVTAKDADGNIVTNFNAANNPVTIAESNGNGVVSGIAGGANLDSSSNFVNGVASLTNMIYTGTNGSHILKATAGNAVGSSNSVSFESGALDRFELALNNNQKNDSNFTSATLTAKDAGGNTITNFDSANDPVTITVNSGTLTNNVIANSQFINGTATITNLNYSGSLGTKTFTATSGTDKTGTTTSTIIVGDPVTIKIVNGNTATATEVDTLNILSDQTITLYSAGYDAGGNWTGLVSSNWSNDGTLSPAVTSQNIDSINFSPGTAPASGTITATFNSISDSTGTISVTPGSVDHFVIIAPSNAEAGEAFDATVIAVDADGNTISNYNGPQTITFNGPGNGANGVTPSYPGQITFLNGTATANISLVKAETTTLTINVGSRTGQSGPIVVNGNSQVTRYVMSAPSNVIAGNSFDISISAVDDYGNLAQINGPLNASFTGASASPDGTAPILPQTIDFTSGTSTFTARLFNKQTATLNVTINAVNGTSNSILIGSAAAESVSKTSGDNQTGSHSQPLPNPIIVTVLDLYGNPKDNYPISFTVTQGGGTVNSNFTATIQTSDDGKASATWTLGPTYGTSSNTLQASALNLTGSPLTFTANTSDLSFRITLPPNIKVGIPFTPQISLVDSSGNVDTSYTGTKSLTFSGPSNGPNGDQPQYPATVNFVNGVAQPPYEITLVANETTTLTVTDGSYTGTATAVTPTSGDATRLVITTAPQQTTVNTATSAITTCLHDQYGNTVLASANRTVSFSSQNAGSQFASDPNGPWYTSPSITITSGMSCGSIYYRNSTVGVHTINARSQGLSDTSQQVTITSSTTNPPNNNPPTNTGNGSTTTTTTNTTNTTNNYNTYNYGANANASSQSNSGINVYTDKPSKQATGSSSNSDGGITALEMPLSDGPVITAPTNGSFVAPPDDDIIITGTAKPKYLVIVKLTTGEVVGSATSDSRGQWKMHVSRHQFEYISNSIIAEYADQKTRSAPVSFTVRAYSWWEGVLQFFQR